MADVARCLEAIAACVQDAREPISHRSLASQVGGASAARAEALARFWKENGGGVGALHVTVARGAQHTDPRARVIRVSTNAPNDTEATIYGVYPSAKEASEEEAHEAMTLAMWAQERKIRNELFAALSRSKPLSRELRAFYDSDVQCKEATSRDMGEDRGEEAVSMFDSIAKTTTSGRSQPAAPAQGKSSFFKSSAPSSSTTTAASKSNSSFFGSSSTTSSSKAKANTAASNKNKTPAPSGAKRIDADTMSNVLTVDSDEDSDDGGAPKFVKKSISASKPRPKRVMVSDDDEEDDDVEVVAPPAKRAASPPPTARTATKRKLSESPEAPPAKKQESPKRKREEPKEIEAEEPQDEDDTLPTGPIKRRQLVTKTRINDEGYMVTEKAYEEVEVSVEELAKERAEAKKKAAAAKAAADAQKARAAAAAAASSKTSKSSGPAKQKKLDFFFARK